MLLNDRLNMETLGCTKCGGEIQVRSVIKFAIIDTSSENEGEKGVSPQRVLQKKAYAPGVN